MDYFLQVPVELQEAICKYIDTHTLLKMCCVSRGWDRAISSLQMLWRQRFLMLGPALDRVPTESDSVNWKTEVTRALSELREVLQGSMPSSCFELLQLETPYLYVEGLSYSEGLLAAVMTNIDSHRNYQKPKVVVIWRVADQQAVYREDWQDDVTAVCLDGCRALALGRSNGKVQLEVLNKEGCPIGTRWTTQGPEGAVRKMEAVGVQGIIAVANEKGHVVLMDMTTGQIMLDILPVAFDGINDFITLRLEPASHPYRSNHLAIMWCYELRVVAWPHQDFDSEPPQTVFQRCGDEFQSLSLHGDVLAYMLSGAECVVCRDLKTGTDTEVRVPGAHVLYATVGNCVLVQETVNWQVYMKAFDLQEGKQLTKAWLFKSRRGCVIYAMMETAVGETNWLKSLAHWKASSLVLAFTTHQSGICLLKTRARLLRPSTEDMHATLESSC